jgi:hypothetical protein
MTEPILYPCPCCGYLVFYESPGSDEICPVCAWQDDLFALLRPFEPMGPNSVSLAQGQANVRNCGVSDYKHVGWRDRRRNQNVPGVDPDWRPIDPQRDLFSSEQEKLPDRPELAYYWRDNYWLKASPPN